MRHTLQIFVLINFRVQRFECIADSGWATDNVSAMKPDETMRHTKLVFPQRTWHQKHKILFTTNKLVLQPCTSPVSPIANASLCKFPTKYI